jgi:hypothetical protein
VRRKVHLHVKQCAEYIKHIHDLLNLACFKAEQPNIVCIAMSLLGFLGLPLW